MMAEHHSRISNGQAGLIGGVTGLVLLLPAIAQRALEIHYFRLEGPLTGDIIVRREIIDTFYAVGPRAVFFLAVCVFLGLMSALTPDKQPKPRLAAEAVRDVTRWGTLIITVALVLTYLLPSLCSSVFGSRFPPSIGLLAGGLLGLFSGADELDKRNTPGGSLIWWLCRVPSPPESTASERVSQRGSWWGRFPGIVVPWLAVPLILTELTLLHGRGVNASREFYAEAHRLSFVMSAWAVGALPVWGVADGLCRWRRKKKAAATATAQADDEKERLAESAPPTRREAMLGMVGVLDALCAKKQSVPVWQKVMLGMLTALVLGGAPVVVGSIVSFVPKLHVLLGKSALACLPTAVRWGAESDVLLHVNLPLVGIYLGCLAGMGALWATLEDTQVPTGRESVIAGTAAATVALLGALAAGLLFWHSPILGPFYAAFGGGGLLAWLTAILACQYIYVHVYVSKRVWTPLFLFPARLVLAQPPVAQLQGAAPEEPVSSNRLALIGAVTSLLILLVPTAIAGWGWMHPELMSELDHRYQVAIGSLPVHSRITLVLGWLVFTVSSAGLMALMACVPGEAEESPASLRSVSVEAMTRGMYATLWAVAPFLYAATFIPILRYYVFGPMGTWAWLAAWILTSLVAGEALASKDYDTYSARLVCWLSGLRGVFLPRRDGAHSAYRRGFVLYVVLIPTAILPLVYALRGWEDPMRSPWLQACCFGLGGLLLLALILVNQTKSGHHWRQEMRARARAWRPTAFTRRPWLLGLLCGMLVAVGGAWAVHYNRAGGLEHFAQEQLLKIRPLRVPLSIRHRVIDVADGELDDRAQLASDLATVVQRVNEAGAAAIVLAVPEHVLPGRGRQNQSEREALEWLAETVGEAGNVFLTRERSPAKADPLADAARGLGHLRVSYASSSCEIVDLRPEEGIRSLVLRVAAADRVFRWANGSVPLFPDDSYWDRGPTTIESLPRTLSTGMDRLAERLLLHEQSDEERAAWLQNRIPWRAEMIVAQGDTSAAGRVERPVWLSEVVEGFNAPPPADPQLLREQYENTVVLIGPNRSGETGTPLLSLAGRAVNTMLWQALTYGSGSVFLTPFDPQKTGYASEASAIILLLVVSILAGIVGAHFRPGGAAGLLGVGLIVLAGELVVAYKYFDVIFPILTPIVCLVAAGILGMESSRRLVEIGRERTVQLFGRYVSRQVAEEILEQGVDEPGGQRRTVTVLFADIRAFGRIAEKLEPEELVALVNDYFSIMIDVTLEFNGTLDKFIGDAVMSVWGTPLQRPDDTANAARAAVVMRDRANALSEQRAAAGQVVADLAFGLNTGEVVAGNIGNIRRMEYTVMGDGVNVAARMQEIASRGPAYIVIGESTYEELKSMIDVRPLGSVPVKHREEPVEIYELLGLR